MELPDVMAHEAVHDTVLTVMRDAKRGKVLDVPAGRGALGLGLKDLGFEVSCCDLYPTIFNQAEIEIRQGNLDGKLPYEDESFDHIACIEGLEHIENPANAIREFARLLKPQGQLLVSVPNIMNIEERLKWLFSGYTSHFKPVSQAAAAKWREQLNGMEEMALHINPIGYSEVRYWLEKSGFQLQQTYFDKQKNNTWLFYPIAGVIKLASMFSSANKRKERWTDELNSNQVLLGGNTLIFRAKKISSYNKST
jgi:ubiquinone/menaquinone biosynthesis C-methylase UbiE